MCDTGKLYRDASVLALRKKQVDRLQREMETLEAENERMRAALKRIDKLLRFGNEFSEISEIIHETLKAG